MEFINSVLEFLKSEILLTVVGAVWLLIEYFLGKTNLVKSGSTLEFVLNSIIKLFELLKIKKPK